LSKNQNHAVTQEGKKTIVILATKYDSLIANIV